MPAPDRQTMARRSEVVSQCAKRARLWAILLLSACLNPRPEELPSNDDGPGLSATPGEGSVNAGDPGAPHTPSDDRPETPPAPGTSEPPSAEGESPRDDAADAGPSDAGVSPLQTTSQPQSEAGDPPE